MTWQFCPNIRTYYREHPLSNELKPTRKEEKLCVSVLCLPTQQNNVANRSSRRRQQRWLVSLFSSLIQDCSHISIKKPLLFDWFEIQISH